MPPARSGGVDYGFGFPSEAGGSETVRIGLDHEIVLPESHHRSRIMFSPVAHSRNKCRRNGNVQPFLREVNCRARNSIWLEFGKRNSPDFDVQR